MNRYPNEAACDISNFVASIPQDRIGQWITDHPKTAT